MDLVNSAKDLRRRRDQSTQRQYFCDLWSIMHRDDAPAFWWPRALSCPDLLSLSAVAAGDPKAKRLQTRLTDEIAERDALVARYAPAMARGATPLDTVRLLSSPAAHEDLIYHIAATIDRHFQSGSLVSIEALTNWFASEIAWFARSRKGVILSFHAARGNDANFGCASLIENLFGDAKDIAVPFRVSFELAPVEIAAGRVTIALDGVAVKLVTQPNPKFDASTPGAKAKLLVGMESNERAPSAELAFQDALDKLKDCLAHLRIQHYIRTTPIGSVTVTRGDDIAHFSLDRPFFRSRGGMARAVPNLAAEGDMPPASPCDPALALNWHACRWHVSNAVAVWGEDTHAAASIAWQALESLYGSVANIWARMPADLVASGAPLMRHYLFNLLGKQQTMCRRLGHCDWPEWSTLDLLDDAAVSHAASDWRKWKSLPLSNVVFHPAVGFLRHLDQQTQSQTYLSTFARRVRSDLVYLYGIRNAIVHRGERIGSQRLANYLATLALEGIFAISGFNRTGN